MLFRSIVLIAGSVFSVLMGPVIDRRGKIVMTTVGVGVMFLGLMGLYLTRTTTAVTLAGVVMMSGYMLITATLSALIRDFTPVGQVGVFQGVRMVFQRHVAHDHRSVYRRAPDPFEQWRL